VAIRERQEAMRQKPTPPNVSFIVSSCDAASR
jgi:hypothetical protein